MRLSKFVAAKAGLPPNPLFTQPLVDPQGRPLKPVPVADKPMAPQDQEKFLDDPEWSVKQEEHWGKDGAGVLFACAGRILLLKRSPHVTEPGTWGIPGGAIPISNKTNRPKPTWKSAMDESKEELGSLPIGANNYSKKYVYRGSGFKYTTFLVEMPASSCRGWRPHLDWENVSWGWFAENNLPRPLHFGIKWLLQHYKPWNDMSKAKEPQSGGRGSGGRGSDEGGGKDSGSSGGLLGPGGPSHIKFF